MKFLFVLLFPIMSFASVIELSTPEQVKTELAKPGPIALMYGAPWCPACKAATPEFEKASNEMKNVRFYKMDVDKLILKEHKNLFQYIPFFVVGKDESELRNNPCKERLEKRTSAGFQKYINKCLEK